MSKKVNNKMDNQENTNDELKIIRKKNNCKEELDNYCLELNNKDSLELVKEIKEILDKCKLFIAKKKSTQIEFDLNQDKIKEEMEKIKDLEQEIEVISVIIFSILVLIGMIWLFYITGYLN